MHTLLRGQMPGRLDEHLIAPSTSRRSHANKIHVKASSSHPGERDQVPCMSGGSSGLCSCKVVLRTATMLPLTIAGIRSTSLEDNDVSDGDQTDGQLTLGRWLVVVNSTAAGDLILSLFRASRGISLPDTAATCAKDSTRDGYLSWVGACSAKASGASENEAKRIRRSVRLTATWKDWSNLGYPPLQWMSHAQKTFLARLALSWVSVRKMNGLKGPQDSTATPGSHINPKEGSFAHAEEEFCLEFRAVLAAVTRVVRTVTEPRSSHSACDGGSRARIYSSSVRSDREICRGCGRRSKSCRSSRSSICPSSKRSSGSDSSNGSAWDDCGTVVGRVVVRDEGGVFRVVVASPVGSNTHSQGYLLDQTFGKEAWRDTGLGELLWIDYAWRPYLASRISYQVRSA